jgi:serine/threonine-protein kinase
MSQRFIRCPHCGLPHDVLQVICASSGKAIRREKSERPLAADGPQSKPPPPSPARAQPPGMPSRAATRDLIARTIGGKYVVRSVLGEGGMGTVFEAEHLTIGRSVAVKVLHPNQARKKDAVRRFHHEARAAGAIGHPNICEVYDLGTLDDGSPYLVMERLVGETLADRIAAEGGLPFDDVIDTLVQVLSGLVAAHEKGIVHRDIKPENVFLTRRVGCPPLCKLLDFGVSKMIGPLVGQRDEDLDLTRTGMVMGTPYYMSPEQARGDRNLDARVDLYACGVIFYEALTGRRPFTAANYNALLIQILSSKPKPARELRPALPAGFDAVLEKAMARNRDDRYRAAADFQRDLQSLRDRYNSPLPPVVGQVIRAVAQPKTSPPPPPEAPVARSAVAPPPRTPQALEPTPSSVEIPITFSNDTPLSGENVPVDATDLEPPPRSGLTPSDASEFEEYPTQVQQSPFPHQLAEARSVRDTDVTGTPAISDTDATGKPAALRSSRRTHPDAREPHEPHDEQDTIIRPTGSFPMSKRRTMRKQAGTPDDTIKVDTEVGGVEDPTQLMASRVPKVPRR